ncbi:putative quinol monooxygenase [Phytohabitans kaempferiae]|uniref:Quinol monooxygenase n=1 Tax=Phytohabitans kaempferiae TaxID=1620943 RepID=A0ABV6MCZ1_9ACTN
MIIIAGWLRVEPAAREAYLADSRKVLEQARSAPGCLDFSLTADLIEPDRINVFERWESDEQLAAFRGAGPEGDQAAQILDASVAKYRISAEEPP